MINAKLAIDPCPSDDPQYSTVKSSTYISNLLTAAAFPLRGASGRRVFDYASRQPNSGNVSHSTRRENRSGLPVRSSDRHAGIHSTVAGLLLHDRLSSAEGWRLRARPWNQALAFSELPRSLFSPADALTLLTHFSLRRLLIGSSPLYFAKEPFALKLLLQNSQGLFDIVVANENFQSVFPSKRYVFV